MTPAIRIWADENGQSHLADLALDFRLTDILPPAPPVLLTPPAPATGYAVARVPAGWHSDWHAAPGRQLVVYLAGSGQIRAGDGDTRTLGPGTILLVDDVAGAGHITAVTGTEEMLVVVVNLPHEREGRSP